MYENIEVPLNARNIKGQKKRAAIKDIMNKLGISELAKKYPNQISGGEQQRTAIARAFVSDTKYILADEPTGALDYENAIELMELIKELHKAGKTIIMVTHDSQIASYADRIVELK